MDKITINKKISTNDKDYIIIKFKEYREVSYINIPINIEFKKNNSNKVIIILPWNWGTHSWYNNKYYKIVDLLSKNDYASIICLENKTQMWLSSKMIWLLKLETTINEVLKNPFKYSNVRNPDIYLIWNSDWWSIVSTISFFFPQIKKILLIAPSILVWKIIIENFVPKFKWKVYILIWEEDEVVWVDIWKYFYSKFNCNKKILIIPNCKHRFEWDKNFNLFINSPIYAFKDLWEFWFEKLKDLSVN